MAGSELTMLSLSSSPQDGTRGRVALANGHRVGAARRGTRVTPHRQAARACHQPRHRPADPRTHTRPDPQLPNPWRSSRPTHSCPRSLPTSSARSQGQGWPQATRKGIRLDRGEDDATITNRGHTNPEMISNQPPENATVSQGTGLNKGAQAPPLWCLGIPLTVVSPRMNRKSSCPPQGISAHQVLG
jgi:hypothetical protein